MSGYVLTTKLMVGNDAGRRHASGAALASRTLNFDPCRQPSAPSGESQGATDTATLFNALIVRQRCIQRRYRLIFQPPL